MTVDTQKLHELARAARLFSDMPGSLPPLTVKAHINGLSDCVESACTEIDAQAAEIERLKKALRVAVLALAHATQEHGKTYEPAYETVDAALSGEPT